MNAPPHPRLHCRWTGVGKVGAAACQQPDAFGVARMGLSRNAPGNARFRQADFADPANLRAALKGIEVAVGLQRRSAARRFRGQHGQRLPRAWRSPRHVVKLPAQSASLQTPVALAACTPKPKRRCATRAWAGRFCDRFSQCGPCCFLPTRSKVASPLRPPAKAKWCGLTCQTCQAWQRWLRRF